MRPCKEGWADEISGISKNLAASGHFGSVLCCDIEIGGDFGEMLFADQRADFSGGIQRVANLYGVDPLYQTRLKGFFDIFMYQKPRR